LLYDNEYPNGFTSNFNNLPVNYWHPLIIRYTVPDLNTKSHGMTIMRNLAMALLLSATLPVFASVEADLKNGSSAADIIAAATAGCEGASCADQAVADLIAAGVSLEVVIAAAIDSGLSQAQAVASVTVAAVSAGQTVATVMSAAQDAGVSDAVVVQGVTAAGTDTATVQAAATANNISAADIATGTVNAANTASGNTGNTDTGNTDTVVVDETTTPEPQP
jgi:hypothetical protein